MPPIIINTAVAEQKFLIQLDFSHLFSSLVSLLTRGWSLGLGREVRGLQFASTSDEDLHFYSAICLFRFKIFADGRDEARGANLFLPHSKPLLEQVSAQNLFHFSAFPQVSATSVYEASC